MPAEVRGRDVALLAALLALMLGWAFVPPPIGLHGEAREGLVVRDIVQRGAWILPYRNGEVPSKPPLFHWLAALAALAFGFGDTALRLPSALAAWVVAAATFVLGTAIDGRRTGWLAVGVLLGMVPFLKSAAEARVDMVLTACLTVCLAALFFWYRAVAEEGGEGRGARAVVWLGAAAAVLAKGPLGLVLPAAIVVAFLAWMRRPELVRRLWSWPLAAAVVLVDGGWYWLASRIGGEAFLARQLLHENVERLVGAGEFAQHRRHHSYFRLQGALALEFLPWNLALVVAARDALRRRGEDAAGRFLHAWWLVVLVLFSVSLAKRPIYLLPLAPPLALLAARRLARLARDGRATLVAAAVVVVAAGTVTISRLTWTYHARRESLAGFATEVAARLPPGAPLDASRDLDEPALLTLAYRLDRPLRRVRPGCTPDGYLLVPGAQASRLAARGFERLASSELPRAAVALVRTPADAACAETPAAADSRPRR